MLIVKGIPAIVLILLGFLKNTQAQDDSYRLPPNYKIFHYDIDLVVPAESFTANASGYSGSVEIRFQVTVQTSEVKLHASYSNIELLTIQLDNSTALTNDRYSVNSTTNILTLQFPTELLVGQDYLLKITFNAQLLGGGGFYKVSYKDHNNELQYIATTQFQATNARNAFPCFDEPTYRSTFAFNLTYPADMYAWTNSPSVSNYTDETTNITKTEFAITPNMPVYLVAFTIAKYTCSEGDLEGSTDYKHRVCSRLDQEAAREWAMDITPKVVDHLNTYTGINYTYSLSKLDQIAVPGKSGAMENWGLVIYGESALLFNSTLQTSLNKQNIAAIIAHELAHQWFGNLVTCKWWSETFLNEGFATLFQYYTPADILPGFDMENQFIVRILQPILAIDGNQNVPALRSNASTPSEISSKFGSYTYNKGASVLRMIEHIVGRDNFKTGIKKYLLDNQYKPVEPQDLWDALENVTENSVSNLPPSVNLTVVVDNWINKGGYPVLNVSLNGTTITFSQQRFLYSGTDNENSSWYVPVTYSTGSINDSNADTIPRGWVTPTESFELTGFTNSSEWIVVNNQQTGFYRVHYDDTLRANLAAALKQTNFSGIHVANRAQIVEDNYMLARARYISFADVLRVVEFLANDLEYIPWYSAVGFYGYLLQRTGSSTTIGAALTSHLINSLTAIVDTVPLDIVDQDNQIYTLKQILVNTYACKFGSAVCAANAKKVFANYRIFYERPNINIRSIVYCNAIRYSDDPINDWNFLFKQYYNSSVSADSSTIWSALGCATNTTVLDLFLQQILTNNSVVDSSLYTSIFSTIYVANDIGVDTALDFFINNYQAILDVYEAAGLNARTILINMASYFTTTEQIEKLENFVSTTQNLSSTIVAAANTALSTARSNQAIIDAHKSELYAYFGLNNDESASTTMTTAATSTAESTSTTASSSTTESTTSTITTPTTITTITTTTTTTMLSSTSTEVPGGEPDSATTLQHSGLVAAILIALINSLFSYF